MLDETATFLTAAKNYLQDSLSIKLSAKQWSGKSKLPHFLAEPYDFYQTNILGTECLLLINAHKEEITPSQIRKQMDKLKAMDFKKELIFVTQNMTSYNRQRLVQQRVPFIVPSKQMYLPPLAIDFKEHFKSIKMPVQKFKPSTQVVLLHLLLRAEKQNVRPIDCIKPYEYAAMTISRAFDDIQEKEICPTITQGRERTLQISHSKKEIWEKSLSFLKSPVAAKHHIMAPASTKKGIMAGLSALAFHTELQAPANPSYAMSKEQWKTFYKNTNVQEVSMEEPGSCSIEVWNYNPEFFSTDNTVDPFSLYLSLQTENDERTRKSLESMLKKALW